MPKKQVRKRVTGAIDHDMKTYPKRLIEVDLPIKRISANARREKSIRHGHISTLHIWWARRPLAACRAVICAALWPDPADPDCPETFREAARTKMLIWAKDFLRLVSADSYPHFVSIQKTPSLLNDNLKLRQALLDFIADFTNWDNSTVREYLDTSRALTQAAHESLGGISATRPLIVDPFAGGGSIPLEALRVGADTFASDLNPIAVLLNKVVLEYIPKYGQRLSDEVRKCGESIIREAKSELAEFYPKDPDGATPISYLWARTIQCEGPGCGAEVPLIRSLWLAKKGNRFVALRLIPNLLAKQVDFQIIVKQRGIWMVQDDLKTVIENPKFEGTVKRGSATCPCCGYTTPVARVREQLKARRGGSSDARPMCVLTVAAQTGNRTFRLPTQADIDATAKAAAEMEKRENEHFGMMSLIPDEEISLNEIRRINVPIYGMTRWGDLFTPRQKLAFSTITRLLLKIGEKVSARDDAEFVKAVQAGLGCVLSKVLDRNTAIARWEPNVQCSQQVFGRQAIAMVWDFGEPAIFEECAGSWPSLLDVWLGGLVNIVGSFTKESFSSVHIETANAASHPLPDDSADALITDPPYYDAVPYAHLSDFFYVWQRRHLFNLFPSLFAAPVVTKDQEIVVDRPHELSTSTHDIAYYERELTRAFADSRRVIKPTGLGTIVFASKTTASWEAILKAVVEAGWVITGSWPIDTEMESRMNAMGTATLASSVHIVVRPRENADGSLRLDEIGDWRDVLQELPRRIHEWMPRLAEEGVVGADAIFACLGPALEIFSRFSGVEKASGETVSLKEYLEHVWAAVAKEALAMIFTGADTSGFEEDARLTAMWLWTLNAGAVAASSETDDVEEDDSEDGTRKLKPGGFILEYDAARKIAQGLGAHMEKLRTLVEVSGETARLLPVAERAIFLFGKEAGQEPARKRKKETSPQLSLFQVLGEADEMSEKEWSVHAVHKVGETVLDRVHQSMILFAANRSEALKRFLVEEGVGSDQRFWRLAQAFSALYPPNTDEKRWVDGVLARKKGLGF